MIRYTCPSCQRQYESVTALAGFTVICLTCKQPILIPAASAAPEETGMVAPPESRPEPTTAASIPDQPGTLARAIQTSLNSVASSPRPDALQKGPPASAPEGTLTAPADLPAWGTLATAQVASGLLLCLVAVAVALAALGVALAGVVLFLMDARAYAETISFLLYLSIGLAWLVAGIALLGMGRCLQVPEQTGYRPYVVAAVVCTGITWAVAIVSVIALVSQSEFLTALARNLTMPANLLQFAGHISFLVFLKGLAEFVQHEYLVARARLLIVLGLVPPLLSVAGYLLPFLAHALWFSPILYIIWLVLYLILLAALRNRLRRSA